MTRSALNYDRDAVSLGSGLVCLDKSLTQQHQKDESDINVIVKRFGITGQLPQGVRAPTYMDFDDVIDFRTAMDAIRAAQASFDRMPAEVRARFGNDPAAFVDFCSEPGNLPEMRRLGLAEPAPAASEPAPATGVPASG